ncbi:MAG: glycosyltransferase family 2 protein [Clostridia bacterium]|nr:glycosyltransferase family 2 protein [Clostridia bacterium]
MKLSIIIPVYNVEDYIKECLDSVLSQKGDFEVIAVDDGSKDKSADLCRRIAGSDPRLRVISQENRGAGGARNTGIRQASGEWLMFVDADDTLAPGAVERVESLLEKDPDMVIFRMGYTDGDGNPVARTDDWRGEFEAESFYDRKDLLLSTPNPCDKVIRRSLFTDNGVYFPEKVWLEDLRAIPKLISLCKKVISVGDVLYFYRERGGSTMNDSDAAKNSLAIDAFDDILGWFESRKTFEALKDELEMLAVRHLLLAATVRVLRADPSSPLPDKFVSYMNSHFPDFRSNRYLGELSRSKRLAFRLAAGRRFGILGALFRLKDRLR